MFALQDISSEQTLDLRSRILRPGQDLSYSNYPEDRLPSTFHLGISSLGKIVCNGTFIQQGHGEFPKARYPYRLRGMASDLQFQKKGLGSILIKSALVRLQERSCDLLWFNARISAEIFYQKLGFKQIDSIFDIPSIGPHRVMFKWLNI